MNFLRRVFTSPHFAPLLLFSALAIAYWSPVLFTGRVLLPGNFLGGFAPFGSKPNADWNILQWDALGQYFPWRVFAARELRAGHIPLWNPYQFSGAPFVANGQSAVFYPLNFVFWILDPAYAFGISALLHTLLAGWSTYFLARRWKLSRGASLLAAIAFAFCGYLASWIVLPTLADTASWLPLCLLLFEPPRHQDTNGEKGLAIRIVLLSLALACALLAGHAQIFFYILVALFLRALFLTKPLRALSTLFAAFVFSLMLGALQLLPTLELARNGHRAGAKPSAAGWEFLQERALHFPDLFSLVVPQWPQLSTSENFGYVGLGVLALGIIATIALRARNAKFETRNLRFALALAAFGILYATATPLSQAFYFGVPGLAQMGGVGRALVLWSLGAALLAGFGLDALRQRASTPVIPVVALILIGGELFWNGMNAHPSAPRNEIYPDTQVTQFLQLNTQDGARVLFLTPRNSWLPREYFRPGTISHPAGVLPPNGAMVYGLNDVNGYDSLAPRAYREFVTNGGDDLMGAENSDVSPPLNGNMILLNNPNSPALDTLHVRYIVSRFPLVQAGLKEVLRADDCIVYERARGQFWTLARSGKEFSPGWRDGKYQPESFRFGLFVSLLALGLCAFVLVARRGASTSEA